ncbi:uncharacterized protein LOC129581242 [Paramacrobiotus metropolitanus]|uniref:uncharacterized protein LOC129581242 n=1 Tax=Paramacrobiotus metropolitanus TaxID=2943436 RepID=UPI0024461D7A|nr:uncharacterized protein LOC129581242 [Paramacrobiotus metropolitanus]
MIAYLPRCRRVCPSSISFRIMLYVLGLLVAAFVVQHQLHPDCPPGTDGERYVTWEIPSWAYFNNQILLHVTVAAYNPLHSRVILSPGFQFNPIQGLQHLVVLPFGRVFEQNLTDFRSKKPLGVSMRRTVYLQDVKKILEDGCGYATELVNDREDLWGKMYTRFVVRVFLLGLHHDVSAVISRFRYTMPLRQCIDSALQTHGRKISRSIGIHIRTWKRDVSVVSHACDTINGHNPLRYLFVCDLTTEAIVASIERVRKYPYQDLFLATDDVDHPVVKSIMAKYPTIQYEKNELDECLRGQNLSAKDLEFWSAMAHPLIQNELLVQADAFVGSFFSTFTQVVAIKRGMVRVEFFQTEGQRLFYRFLYPLGLVVVAVLMLLPTVFDFLVRKSVSRDFRLV